MSEQNMPKVINKPKCCHDTQYALGWAHSLFMMNKDKRQYFWLKNFAENTR